MRMDGEMESHERKKLTFLRYAIFELSTWLGLHPVLTSGLEIPTQNLQQFSTSKPERSF